MANTPLALRMLAGIFLGFEKVPAMRRLKGLRLISTCVEWLTLSLFQIVGHA